MATRASCLMALLMHQFEFWMVSNQQAIRMNQWLYVLRTMSLLVAWIKRRTTAAAACSTEHIQSLHSCRAKDNHTVYTELYLLLLFYRALATDIKERGLRSPSSSSSTWIFLNFASILWNCFILNDLYSSKTPLFIINVASFLDTVLLIKSFWICLIMHLNLKIVRFDICYQCSIISRHYYIK